jgi:Zn-dependent oligopeptidase
MWKSVKYFKFEYLVLKKLSQINTNMKIFNQIKDSFTSTEFEVEITMKVTDLTKQFKNKFGLSLRVYKGKKLADDGRMTLKTLDQRTTQTSVNFDSNKMKIKATQKVLEVENLFLENFGIVVQIADIENKKLLADDITLGDAKRLKL